MAIKRPVKALGPGSLVFGETGTDLDLSCQVTACKVTFDSDKEDDLPTLCGGNIVGEKTYSAKLEFSAGQDTELDGLADWTWKHAGDQVPVKFIPNEGETAQIVGTVVVDPVEFGGDVRKRNIAEAEWDFVGLPTFTPDGTADSEEYPALVAKTFTLPGGTTGGTWTATVDGQTTTAIAFDASAATVKAAFEALPNVGTVSVSAGAGSWTVTGADLDGVVTADGSTLTPAGTVTVS